MSKTYRSKKSGQLGALGRTLLSLMSLGDGQVVAVDADTSAQPIPDEKFMLKESRFKDKLNYELDLRLKKMFKPYSFNRTVNRMQKITRDNNSLASELCLCFSSITDYMSAHKEGLEACLRWDIISGINETLLIKVEAIRENLAAFESDGLDIIKSYKEEYQEPDLEPLTEKAMEFLKMYYDILDPAYIIEFVEDMLDYAMESKQAGQMKGRAKRLHEDRMSSLIKRADLFKKDDLLFELSTFEEIMNHSISRLREEGGGEIPAYIHRVDKAAEDIKDVLKKHNIMLIRPEPHQPFDPKEHEILVAESNEEFQKGQVIRLLNSGYKHNETILMRANVIAAK